MSKNNYPWAGVFQTPNKTEFLTDSLKCLHRKKHFLLVCSLTFFLSAIYAYSAFASGVRAPSQGTIKISPAQPAPGDEVTVTWTLKNTTALPITGKIVYYLGSYPLNDLGTTAVTTLKPGDSAGNTFTFLPYPGWNQISVVFLNTQVVPPSSRPPTILQPIDPSQPPKPKPSAGSSVAPIPVSKIFPATVSIAFDDTGTPSSTIRGGLSAAMRKQLLTDYSPLLLYSYDHNSEEQYPPIDAVPFVQGSSLFSQVSAVPGIPNSTLQGAAAVTDILNPGGPGDAGTITTSASPVKVYLEPNNATRHGAAWTSSKVGLNAQGMNIGLYGRAILLDLANLSLTDPALPAASLLARYRCTHGQTCSAQVVKLEYWQLYGYSADYNGNAITESEANHQGDWCGVQVYVDANWAQSSRPDRAILWVVHYLHGKQVGFNMAMANPIETPVTVPKRSAGDTGPTYSAQEVQGPNYGQSVAISVMIKGTWEPPGGPNLTQQLFQAQNNVLRLATEEAIVQGPARVSAGGHFEPPKINISYRHPVVYVEWGGHEFWPTDAWTIYAASKHNGTGKYSYFGDSPTDITASSNNSVPPTVPSQADVALVTLFAGFWGAPQSNNGPPQGPPLHCEFYWDPATNPALLKALHAGDSVDPAALQAGQIGGTCGGGRPY
jgi:hypothetical protein